MHTLTIIPSSKYHELPWSLVLLIPVVSILLSHLSVGYLRISSQTASPVSEEFWTFPVPPIDPAYRMGPFLPVLLNPASYLTPIPTSPASGPSLEAVTLGWGAVLGLGSKVGGSPILGWDIWMWGLDQPGEGTAPGVPCIGELAALDLGASQWWVEYQRSLEEAKQRGYMGPSTRLYWGSCLS